MTSHLATWSRRLGTFAERQPKTVFRPRQMGAVERSSCLRRCRETRILRACTRLPLPSAREADVSHEQAVLWVWP
ncbi:unnamed protein product [Protopolystoma xenopodis]|uniref:Uncharacterized protein n=1 Tax=Protopolystoma xenopodis TaxID=117903 RepID=A0A3S5BFB8_9PLAT|nr:unnamed protein product [Protopolystoma xenopodis]